MKKMHTLWLCSLGLCLFSFTSLALDGEALVQQTCASCHSLERVQQAFGIKNQEAWAATVARMLAKPDAPVVTHAEHGAIVDWLAAQPNEMPGSMPASQGNETETK